MEGHAKRLLDLVGAVAGLLVLSPLLGLVALAVLFSMGRPVLFRQVRPGKDGLPFTVLKFRTMTDARSAAGVPLCDATRLTRVGRFLRATSLDELPQLVNVIAGEMSLVGPRPLLTQYLPLYSQKHRRRHEVLPGITGWAQVNGRNLLSWPQKFDLDVWYVDHRSFLLDLRILLLTALRVLQRQGIRGERTATASAFRGYEAVP